MNSSQLKNAIRLGEVKVGNNKYNGNRHVYWDYSLVIDYDSNFPKNLKNKHLSIVYFILVDNEVYKIGQTSAKNGIAGCLSFYLKAGQDDPRDNRFSINYLMRECIKENKKVEFYIQYSEPVKVQTKGIFSISEVEVPVSAKGMEEACIKDYQSVYGKNTYPVWNFQESGTSPPNNILVEYNSYISKRLAERK